MKQLISDFIIAQSFYIVPYGSQGRNHRENLGATAVVPVAPVDTFLISQLGSYGRT